MRTETGTNSIDCAQLSRVLYEDGDRDSSIDCVQLSRFLHEDGDMDYSID
jgi:hypothetical protein